MGILKNFFFSQQIVFQLFKSLKILFFHKVEKSGEKWFFSFYLYRKIFLFVMARFIGEFECKIDNKGRIILPAKLRLQIPDKDAKSMVINRGFEKCLVLYTSADWNLETEKLNVLNDFNRQARKFIRQFNNGANIVQIDNNSRINIPNNLVEYADLKDDVIISCYNNKIELWNKTHYQEELSFDDEEFSRMAEELMGNKNPQNQIGFDRDDRDD